jgi:hypothetical protein
MSKPGPAKKETKGAKTPRQLMRMRSQTPSPPMTPLSYAEAAAFTARLHNMDPNEIEEREAEVRRLQSEYDMDMQPPPPPPRQDEVPNQAFISYITTPFQPSEITLGNLSTSLDATLANITSLASRQASGQPGILTTTEIHSLHESASRVGTQAPLPPNSSSSESATLQLSSPQSVYLETRGDMSPIDLFYFSLPRSSSQSPSLSPSPSPSPPTLEELEIEMLRKITNGIFRTVEIVAPPILRSSLFILRTAYSVATNAYSAAKTINNYKFTIILTFLLLRRNPILQPYLDMFMLTIIKFIGKHTGITDMIEYAKSAAMMVLQNALDQAIQPTLDALQSGLNMIADLPGDLKDAIGIMVSEFKDELRSVVSAGIQAGAEKAVLDAALNAVQESFWDRFRRTAGAAAAEAAVQTAVGALMHGARASLPALTNSGGKGKRKTNKKRKSNKKRKTKTRRR